MSICGWLPVGGRDLERCPVPPNVQEWVTCRLLMFYLGGFAQDWTTTTDWLDPPQVSLAILLSPQRLDQNHGDGKVHHGVRQHNDLRPIEAR
jgi:hypothetical protein